MAFNYGSREYGQGVYGGYANPYALSSIPIIVEVYDTNLVYKSTYQTGVGDFLGCEFSFDTCGAKEFKLFFAKSVDIDRSDIIKIKLFNSDDYFFTGVVRLTPIDGSTKSEYNYSGFGLNDYLLRINVESKSYANKTLEFIVEDLIDTIITVKTPVTKNVAKLNYPDITLTSLDVNYTQVTEVLDSLKKIADSEGITYITGVDKDGDFFFYPQDTDTKVTLVVGKKGRYGIDTYEPTEEYEAKTKYFVLDKDGSYITTVVSTEANDIFEEKITAPDVDNTSAQRWAEGILAENEIVSKSASVQWKIEENDPFVLVANGNIRIISNIPPTETTREVTGAWGSGTWGSGVWGGASLYTGKDSDDLLKIKEVKYILNGSISIRQIQLGHLPVRLEDKLKQVNKDLASLRVSLGR